MTKVAIIIPVYKVEKYITRCLKSVINQSYKDIEIVMVDDCGDDQSISLADKFLKQSQWDRFSIIHHDKNRGLSAARNTGILNCNSQYVYFLDSDDEIKLNCIEELVTFAESNGLSMVMGGILRRTKSEDISYFKYSRTVLDSQTKIIQSYRDKLIAWNAINRLISRQFLLENHLLFKEGITSEDLLWSFQLLSFIDKLGLLDSQSYIYYDNENSIMTTASNNVKFAYDYLSIIEDMLVSVNNMPIVVYIHYYHEIKYEYIPFSLMWHGYNRKVLTEILIKLYNNRRHDYFDILPFRKKILFLLHTSLIINYKRNRYNLENYWDILLNKLSMKK